jgi:hypothetical protein
MNFLRLLLLLGIDFTPYPTDKYVILSFIKDCCGRDVSVAMCWARNNCKILVNYYHNHLCPQVCRLTAAALFEALGQSLLLMLLDPWLHETCFSPGRS